MSTSNDGGKALSVSDWSKHFKIIYDLFLKRSNSNGAKATNKEFCAFFNISAGKLQKWSQGQWPKAPDLAILHDKLGLSYRWLVTGEGDPFDEAPKPEPVSPNPIAPALPPPAPDMAVELERLRKELEESNRLNRQLVTRLLIDGTGNKPDAQNSDPKAAGL